MTKFKYFVLTAATAFVFTACGAPAGNGPGNNANAANTAAKTAPSAPTKDALVTLEKSAYEAWKSKDAKFWDGFLTANFVGFGATGRLDKASALKEYAGADCDVKSVALSDEQMTPLGNDAAMITYKTTIDGACGGQKVPANSWAAGIYVREGDKWKGAFHAESPVVDPKAPPAKPAAPTKKDNTAAKPAETKPDAATDALIALERKAWEDWKTKNAKGLDDWAGKGLMSFSDTDRTDRAASLKRWAEDKCEIKSVSLTEPTSVAFGSDFALLTFMSAVDGKCDGQSVPKQWGMTIYAKEGGVWKALFTMGSPAA